MALFNLGNRVEYVCVCGLLNPLSNMYFCKHCSKLRCGNCVCHEVDTHFCLNCLENIPSSEARIRKNRCSTCFNCPSCQNLLSVRSSMMTVPLVKDAPPVADETNATVGSLSSSSSSPGSGKQVQKKMYYLACLTCRWNTRDIGLPDQSVATGQWPEPEHPSATRFAQLFDHYRSVALHDKQERQELWRRKAPRPTKYPNLTDRTGLTVEILRRQIGLPEAKAPAKLTIIPIKPAVASEEVEELPIELLTEKLNLNTVSTVQQRLAQPATQPTTVAQLYPQHKLLSIKRSLRCQCDHNVIKPDYNPTSTKYRIALFAAYHAPDVRFVQCDTLRHGVADTYVVLRITNPTVNEMMITILDLPSPEEERALIDEEYQATVALATARSGTSSSSTAASSAAAQAMRSLNASLAKQVPLIERPRLVDRVVNGTLTLPDSSFYVRYRDEAGLIDEIVPPTMFAPKFVTWRKDNHAAIRLAVKPNPDVQVGEYVWVGFTLQYTYNNVYLGKPEQLALSTRVYVNLGKLQ
ncbi:dynactin P62 subunit [Anopheles darlingi]|uniref:Dynactin subunit 4 n=1 Tax=Anopheles darlingi TaxID=43151 RepID=W5J6N4_ANODA|nr:dynactin subunit 4 [Anopheles darlingi]ETN60122.1 dynactin P62 subunit [Anopheles darlingi]